MDKEIKISKENFNKSKYERFIIVGDIGGTNAYIAIICSKNNKSFDIIFKRTYLTKDINGFENILNDALKEAKEEYDIEISIACIGAAGPISRKRGYVKLTNVDLKINKKELLAKTMLNKIILVNDFEAIGYGLDLLDLEKDVIKLPHVREDLTGNWTAANTFAVIGAGTGLGISITHYDMNKHLHAPLPSEGGHIDFTPYDKLEMELVEFLKEKRVTKKDVHPELERVLSGHGMENIYNFLITKKEFKKTSIVKKINKLKGTEKLQEIENDYGKDKTCKKTVDMFINFYARAARYLALISECYSGLFITGRIALKNIERLKDKSFMEEFERHDKRSDVLRKIPVYVITNRDVGLYGCCNVAINFFNI